MMRLSDLNLLNRTFTVTDLNTVDQLLSLVSGVINGSHNFTITNHREIKCDKNKQLFASSLPPFLYVYTTVSRGVREAGWKHE